MTSSEESSVGIYRCSEHHYDTQSRARMLAHIDRKHLSGAAKPSPDLFWTDETSCPECGRGVGKDGHHTLSCSFRGGPGAE